MLEVTVIADENGTNGTNPSCSHCTNPIVSVAHLDCANCAATHGGLIIMGSN